jgi:thiol:disulfide interchange protein DsbD
MASVDTRSDEIKDDPSFGRTEVYHQNFAASVACRALAASEQLVLEAT